MSLVMFEQQSNFTMERAPFPQDYPWNADTLYTACFQGDIARVKLLIPKDKEGLERFKDLNKRVEFPGYRKKVMALEIACERKHLEIIEILMDVVDLSKLNEIEDPSFIFTIAEEEVTPRIRGITLKLLENLNETFIQQHQLFFIELLSIFYVQENDKSTVIYKFLEKKLGVKPLSSKENELAAWLITNTQMSPSLILRIIYLRVISTLTLHCNDLSNALKKELTEVLLAANFAVPKTLLVPTSFVEEHHELKNIVPQIDEDSSNMQEPESLTLAPEEPESPETTQAGPLPPQFSKRLLDFLLCR